MTGGRATVGFREKAERGGDTGHSPEKETLRAPSGNVDKGEEDRSLPRALLLLLPAAGVYAMSHDSL